MGTLANIEIALQAKLASINGAPSIQYTNMNNYHPVTGTRYWRATNLPTRSELASASALQKHQGIYQVDIVVPEDKGLAAMLSDMDAIYTAFNTVASLTAGSNRIDILSVGRGTYTENKDGWCKGYIEINYMCYSH